MLLNCRILIHTLRLFYNFCIRIVYWPNFPDLPAPWELCSPLASQLVFSLSFKTSIKGLFLLELDWLVVGILSLIEAEEVDDDSVVSELLLSKSESLVYSLLASPSWLVLESESESLEWRCSGVAPLCNEFNEQTRDYHGLLRQSLKFRGTVSLSLKNAVFKPIISFYVWVHISEGKTCSINPKTCGPSKWPPLTNSMSYSYGRSVSIEKPHDKRRSSLSLNCFI